MSFEEGGGGGGGGVESSSTRAFLEAGESDRAILSRGSSACRFAILLESVDLDGKHK